MEQVDLFIFIELEIIVKMLSLRLCQDLFEVPFSFFFFAFSEERGGGVWGVGWSFFYAMGIVLMYEPFVAYYSKRFNNILLICCCTMMFASFHIFYFRILDLYLLLML